MTVHKVSHRPRYLPILLVVALAAGAVATVPSLRERILRAVGWAIVISEPVASADVVVVSLHSGGAGALEAAELVQGGIAERVAVFMDPPTREGREFERRGLFQEGPSARQIHQLKSLGVADVVQITGADLGTESEGRALATWCDEHQVRSLVFVAVKDHSRRLRRVLHRFMKGHPTQVTVRPARHSNFDPDRWWETHGGIRTEIIELQKLLLDIVLHPLAF